MSWRRRLAKIGALFHRRKPVDDLEEEIRFHLAMEEQENLEAGMPPDEAHYAALRRFGNVTQAQERSREMWGWQWLETLLQDIRYVLRLLRRNPGFTAVAVLTLALGIGANTAVFTLIDETMLKSLPVHNPRQLYGLGNWENCCVMSGFQDNGWGVLSYSLYQQLRDHTAEFSNLAGFQAGRMQLSVRRADSSMLPKPFEGEFVSGNYFATFGVSASVGRSLNPADDHPNSPPVAMMSYRAWQQDFGSDPSVIGATFDINTIPYTVIGVAPKGYFGETLETDPPDFWLPLATEPALKGQASILNHPEECWLYAIGRLKPGSKPRRVQSQLTAELQRWLNSQSGIPAQYRSEIPKQFIQLTPAAGGVARLRSYYAEGLRMLMLLAGVVLLIGCANIANLLLARGAASRLSTAVRAALGAPRGRLVRQVLTETTLLAIVGGLAGLYVAYAGVHVVLLLAFRGSHYVPLSGNPSWLVLTFALALSVATGIVFGFVPAWMNSRTDPANALRGAGRSTGDHASSARHALVVLQVALCLVLLASAGLLMKSLRNLERRHFGFEAQNRWIVDVDPALAGYKPGQLYGLYQELEQRLGNIPGVLSASYSLYGPVNGNSWSSPIHIEGQPGQAVVSWMRIGPRYFETIGTPVLRGRTISNQDTPTSPRVAVVSQAFARKFFHHKNPLGKHFGMGGVSHSGDYEIVGVVADARPASGGGQGQPMFFLPYLQMVGYRDQSWHSIELRSNYAHSIELRVAGRQEKLPQNVRRVLAGINPDLTVINMMSFGEQLSQGLNQDRLMACLTGLFGLLALVLACVGLYGVTSYSVVQRTNEIGIRMALGAQRRGILVLVLRGALAQIALGLAIGVPVALGCTRLLSSLLYGVKPTDPLTFISVSILLIAVALVACYIPARRATKVDPMVALRYE